jgi:phosphatidylserine/phosphatidylglycerophosphate/cardiolipin synthase-like enzyme
MPAFISPAPEPASRTLTLAEKTVPEGLRYGGYAFWGFTVAAFPGSVVIPALGVVRTKTVEEEGAAVETVLELQVDPFPIHRVCRRLARGLPTFYFFLDPGDDPGVTDGWAMAAGENVATAAEVTVVMAFQDRSRLLPALAAREIARALVEGGGTVDQWEPLAAALEAQTAAGPAAPVQLLDAAGLALRGQSVGIVYGGAEAEADYTVPLTEGDRGDLQRAIARLHADSTLPIADVWGAPEFDGVSARLRWGSGGRYQLTRLEDGLTGVDQIEITPGRCHVAAADLHAWFAPQGVSGTALARYRRGCRIRPLVNGREFFDDLFQELHQAGLSGGGGLDLAGWAMHPEQRFARPPAGAPADYPTTLVEAVNRLAGQHGCSFLPAAFIDLADAEAAGEVETLLLVAVVTALTAFRAGGASLFYSDASGLVVLWALMIANSFIWDALTSDDARALEPNQEAVEALNPLAGAAAALAPYPASTADNPLCPPDDEFPFNLAFPVIRHFGVFHQKFAVVRKAAEYAGYCGGIDLNPDRLDDEHHMARDTPDLKPYHDVHLKVEGPAVADLAQSFAERWAGEGVGSVAVAAPEASSLGEPGQDIVQVARTYFRPASSSRALPYAPEGDRTLADTMLAAIAQAREFIFIEDQYLTPPREYREALSEAAGRVRRLVVAVPGLTDQPFGELKRSEFIRELSDAHGDKVIVGAPRRACSVPASDLRVSSGRLRLMADLEVAATGGPGGETIALGPPGRVPPPPFWVAVDGELMWCYADAEPLGGLEEEARVLSVDRGEDTRILAGGGSPKGATRRKHKAGAAATVVQLADIYVHAKLMIVDDAFLAVGSANLNRRGFFHDGEMNCFAMPQSLRYRPDNPVARLRCRLWAELLDLPFPASLPLLQDPVAASRLFGRSYFKGNRFVPADALPAHLVWGGGGGETVLGLALGKFVDITVMAQRDALWDAAVDPTSGLQDLGS